MRLLTFSVLLLSFITFSCKKGPSGQMQKSAEMTDLPKDFLSFYQQFHSDSAYQIAHIEWPLKGEKMEKTESGGNKKVLTEWEPENWKFLQLPDVNDVGLKRYYETMSNVLIIERLQYPMVNFGLERQFYKDENNAWKLIYYAEMQELR